MESIHDVKEAISARSRTATLDELRDRGREQVRVIRAEHIAEMISEAVQRTVEEAGLLPQEEVDALVERSREEFKDVVREREEQASEMEELRHRLDDSRSEVEILKARIAELEGHAAPSGAGDPGAAAAGMGGAEAMVLKLMEEVATLKAQAGQGGAVPAATGAAPAAPGANDLTNALAQITGALNDRLDKFGRKMGISSAVEADDVKFDSLFSDADTAGIESNIDDVKVKQKKGGGIGANLERLKKLKGGS